MPLLSALLGTDLVGLIDHATHEAEDAVLAAYRNLFLRKRLHDRLQLVPRDVDHMQVGHCHCCLRDSKVSLGEEAIHTPHLIFAQHGLSVQAEAPLHNVEAVHGAHPLARAVQRRLEGNDQVRDECGLGHLLQPPDVLQPAPVQLRDQVHSDVRVQPAEDLVSREVLTRGGAEVQQVVLQPVTEILTHLALLAHLHHRVHCLPVMHGVGGGVLEHVHNLADHGGPDEGPTQHEEEEHAKLRLRCRSDISVANASKRVESKVCRRDVHDNRVDFAVGGVIVVAAEPGLRLLQGPDPSRSFLVVAHRRPHASDDMHRPEHGEEAIQH
mmetsp:Transcript_29203/g.83816  ORF Transcript_29203/g.83816 Transcript_29203/m.83816 type:complete len:325 (+) Transcript_29203:464-1438(+)